MHPNDYLTNPVVPKDFYNAKCTAVETTGDSYNPTIMIALQVVPYEPYGDASNAVLHVTLRPTPDAEPLREKFRETFNVAGDPAEAVGRFGCVLVNVGQFRSRQYGAVHFIKQSRFARLDALNLKRADEAGEIPWAEADRDAAGERRAAAGRTWHA